MEVFKEAHVMFQAERVGNILRDLEVTVSGLHLFSASKAVVVKQSETTIDSGSDVQLFLEGRLGLGAQQGSAGVNSHRSCVD